MTMERQSFNLKMYLLGKNGDFPAYHVSLFVPYELSTDWTKIFRMHFLWMNPNRFPCLDHSEFGSLMGKQKIQKHPGYAVSSYFSRNQFERNITIRISYNCKSFWNASTKCAVRFSKYLE